MNSLETIEYIKKNRCNIARYGDGEFNIMQISGDKADIAFQKYDEKLKNALRNTLRKRHNLLICIPYTFCNKKNLNKNAKRFWIGYCLKKQRDIVIYLRENACGGYRFGNSLVTRPYMDLLNTRNAKKIFLNLKTIWDNIDVLVVEGEQTRMGIGNDLLSNAKSIKRILAPSENAYDNYNDILKAIRKHYHGGLVLIALGPTATVLAGELAENNIWALDVGHIDIEYEWYRQKAKGKVAIPGKYVNEAGIEGRTVSECDDFEYLRQIEERLY